MWGSRAAAESRGGGVPELELRLIAAMTSGQARRDLTSTQAQRKLNLRLRLGAEATTAKGSAAPHPPISSEVVQAE
jgi:hypothetical protein